MSKEQEYKELRILSYLRDNNKNFDENKLKQSFKSDLIYKLIKTRDTDKVLEKSYMFLNDKEINDIKEYIKFSNEEMDISDVNKDTIKEISDFYMAFIPKNDKDKFNETGKAIKKYLPHLKAHLKLSE